MLALRIFAASATIAEKGVVSTIVGFVVVPSCATPTDDVREMSLMGLRWKEWRNNYDPFQRRDLKRHPETGPTWRSSDLEIRIHRTETSPTQPNLDGTRKLINLINDYCNTIIYYLTQILPYIFTL